MHITDDMSERAKKQLGMPALTASQLADALNNLVAEHGDLPVVAWDDSSVREVIAYDSDGNVRGKRTEIVLHGWR